MSFKMKRTLWIIGVVIMLFVIFAGIGYLTLRPKPLDPYTLSIVDDDGNVISGSISSIETVVLGGVAQRSPFVG